MNKIDIWFPKSILISEEFDKSLLPNIIYDVTDWFTENGAVRTSIFEVNSTHLTNNKMHRDPRFFLLSNYFLEKARYFSKELGYQETVLQKLYISSMWANVSKEGDFLESHIHQNSFLSGVFYLQCPKDSKIIFYDHSDMSMIPENINHLSYTNVAYDCLPGRLLLWKSNFLHGNPKQPKGLDKIAISFNVGMNND